MKTAITADAAVKLLLNHGFMSELYYSMNIFEEVAPMVPTLATDGRSMWVNADYWRTLTLPLKISAVCHELLHKMLLHPVRLGSREPFIANVAMDIVVNQLLVDNAFELGPGWIQPVPKYKGWSFEAVYADIMKNLPPPKPKSGQGGNGVSVPGFDPDHPDIPQSWKDMWRDVKQVQGTPEEVAKAEQKMQQEVEHALANARAAGNVPKGVEMPMAANRKVAEEPWFNHLHRYMQSLRANAYNWSRFARRQLVCHRIFAPHNITEALGDVGIFVDASGSVYDRAQQARFGEHINAILAECKPAKVYVYYFDTEVHKHIEMDPGEIEFDPQPAGGGGTSFTELWDYAEEQGHVLDLAIVLTDLEGTMPREQPPYPVCWASIERHPVPFGEAIYIS